MTSALALSAAVTFMSLLFGVYMIVEALHERSAGSDRWKHHLNVGILLGVVFVSSLVTTLLIGTGH